MTASFISEKDVQIKKWKWDSIHIEFTVNRELESHTPITYGQAWKFYFYDFVRKVPNFWEKYHIVDKILFKIS